MPHVEVRQIGRGFGWAVGWALRRPIGGAAPGWRGRGGSRARGDRPPGMGIPHDPPGRVPLDPQPSLRWDKPVDRGEVTPDFPSKGAEAHEARAEGHDGGG